MREEKERKEGFQREGKRGNVNKKQSLTKLCFFAKSPLYKKATKINSFQKTKLTKF